MQQSNRFIECDLGGPPGEQDVHPGAPSGGQLGAEDRQSGSRIQPSIPALTTFGPS